MSFAAAIAAFLKVVGAVLDMLGRKQLVDLGKSSAAAESNAEALETERKQAAIVMEARGKDDTLARLDRGDF